MAVSSRLFSFLGPLPGRPGHGRIMRCERREHIVEIAETEYGICLTGAKGRTSVISADYGDPSPSRSDEAAAHRDGSCLGAAVDPQLGEEVGHVGLDSAGADE